ncbi:hypothetical protein BDV95DRAFT_304624 [Massariosphaeria phaeospora]|uniref:Uncharacterized protein n=1 Tax=Massariosphaeria phaeospora TaxID=100035 RepID=A0A7C8IAV0_9PLEO|nr:hypothetical protein BDV95DRAFT_304624 [Massariosphaeria phaeospora]
MMMSTTTRSTLIVLNIYLSDEENRIYSCCSTAPACDGIPQHLEVSCDPNSIHGRHVDHVHAHFVSASYGTAETARSAASFKVGQSSTPFWASLNIATYTACDKGVSVGLVACARYFDVPVVATLSAARSTPYAATVRVRIDCLGKSRTKIEVPDVNGGQLASFCCLAAPWCGSLKTARQKESRGVVKPPSESASRGFA